MDFTSLVEIVIAIVIVYFFIKFIVSPVIKAIVGVIIFLILIYILQKYFGFDFGKVLAPFGISFDSSKWGINLNWILGPINYFADQIVSFFQHMWESVPKNIKQ